MRVDVSGHASLLAGTELVEEVDFQHEFALRNPLRCEEAALVLDFIEVDLCGSLYWLKVGTIVSNVIPAGGEVVEALRMSGEARL